MKGVGITCESNAKHSGVPKLSKANLEGGDIVEMAKVSWKDLTMKQMFEFMLSAEKKSKIEPKALNLSLEKDADTLSSKLDAI